jgi:hypothetical protein
MPGLVGLMNNQQFFGKDFLVIPVNPAEVNAGGEWSEQGKCICLVLPVIAIERPARRTSHFPTGRFLLFPCRAGHPVLFISLMLLCHD